MHTPEHFVGWIRHNTHWDYATGSYVVVVTTADAVRRKAYYYYYYYIRMG
jgi:hypothetical protein